MNIKEIQPQLYAHFEKLVQAENKLSHAYLFVGGFGNFDMAIWLAKALFCQEENKPCGTCRICRLIDDLDYMDLQVIAPDGQSIKVEQVRSLLSNFAEKGFESSRKVVIIREAEKMSLSAANSLLKAIEEPENEVFIFLLTDNEQFLLPTIRSRVQMVHFPKNVEFLVKFLLESGYPREKAELIADLVESVEEASELAAADWFSEGSRALEAFAREAERSPDEAFLSLPNLVASFSDKQQQAVALNLLLVFFHRVGAPYLTQRTFQAQKMWRANVRFGSALESIVL